VIDRTICCVFTKPVAGREREYHEWYDGQHLEDVRRVPGVVSAQRFDPAAAQQEGPDGSFLAVYEIDGDPDSVVGELTARFGTDEMPASGALDLTSVSMTFWSPRRSSDTA
jgi:hypothetical protein